MAVNFTVLGEPQGKGRPRFASVNGKARTFTPDKTVLYENLVMTEYRRQCGAVRFPDDAKLEMLVSAYFAVPSSAGKSKRAQMLRGEIRPTKKPDADNIAKVIADALNEVAYRDDAQIVELRITKQYGNIPMVMIEISEV